jgi:hypothetical protein
VPQSVSYLLGKRQKTTRRERWKRQRTTRRERWKQENEKGGEKWSKRGSSKKRWRKRTRERRKKIS